MLLQNIYYIFELRDTIDIWGGPLITNLEFLLRLKNRSCLILSLLNFDLIVSFPHDFQFLEALTFRGAYDSTGETSFPKNNNVDMVLQQLRRMASLIWLQFVSVEIDKIGKQQFADYKTRQKVTFFVIRNCKEVTESCDIHSSTIALSALNIKFISFDWNAFAQLFNLLEFEATFPKHYSESNDNFSFKSEIII